MFAPSALLEVSRPRPENRVPYIVSYMAHVKQTQVHLVEGKPRQTMLEGDGEPSIGSLDLKHASLAAHSAAPNATLRLLAHPNR